MKKKRLYINIWLLSSVLLFAYLTGCKDNNSNPANAEPQSDLQAFEKLADDDSLLASFDQNYNENGLGDFLPKPDGQINPFRFGHRAQLVSRTITYNVVGDTAFAVMTKIFSDSLLLAVSRDSVTRFADTVIGKSYTSTIVRNLIFVRTGNSNRPFQNWRLAAVSLPQGSTIPHPDISIRRISLVTNSETISLTDPLAFYVARGQGWWRQLPMIPRNTDINLRVQVYSAVRDTDFVTLTWGADKNGLYRAKKKLKLSSTNTSGTGFIKEYQIVFSSNSNAGFSHAVINAFPRNVIYDDMTPVQNESWGFPYFVRRQ